LLPDKHENEVDGDWLKGAKPKTGVHIPRALDALNTSLVRGFDQSSAIETG
jgi:hypothetical protein